MIYPDPEFDWPKGLTVIDHTPAPGLHVVLVAVEPFVNTALAFVNTGGRGEVRSFFARIGVDIL